MNESIAKTLAVLPDKPGVYIMRDEHGKIIYVGKAVVLKNRVRSYFRNLASHTVKVKALVAKVAEIETIVTDSEVEALILECNLIKKHRPRYNIMLKDDKTYPYLKVTLQEDFRVFMLRAGSFVMVLSIMVLMQMQGPCMLQLNCCGQCFLCVIAEK